MYKSTPRALKTSHANSFILTFSCPDRIGIVHAVAALLLERSGYIAEAAQFNDQSTGPFFMRVKFGLPAGKSAGLQDDVQKLAAALRSTFTLHPVDRRMRSLVMVSRLGHCLNDLLFRWRISLIPIDIRAIVSNHIDYADLAASCGLPFVHLPVTPESKTMAEAELLELMAREQVELVVLARYMQVLSEPLCRALAGRAIKIHHSFFPSFKGARPYFQAHDRSVKIIGATAHYVTAALDEGPIIEQGIARVDHAQGPEDLTAIGRDVESVVLSRAVTWHAQHRVLVNGAKTVVFK
ncbi:MAG: formyltetrahydrofolate deformylase [Polaromonas sp.]|nr:formyltetrahydrofolate deformylase [Polaromonas sp.]